MSDLISREKLWKRITSTYDEGLSLDELKSEIDEMPTAEPVKHGQWYDEPNYLGTCTTMYFCSECGSASYREDPYCWHCGSKMDVSDTNVGKMDESTIGQQNEVEE